MDFNTACLKLEINSPFSLSELKKQYRIMALKNHPDKHMPDDNGIYANKFKDINSSYEYLTTFLENNEEEDIDMGDYNSLFRDFLSSFFSNNQYEVHRIVSIIVNDCQSLSVSLFENMDKEKAIQIYEFINTYRHILYIPDDIVERIKQIINEKMQNDNIIILNPSLDDLLNDNIYMLEFEDEKYYVPLWHDEIYYKHKSNDLIVKCIPELPENISIDNDSLIVNIRHSINDIINKDEITCNIGKTNYKIPINKLKIKSSQIYTIYKGGFSLIQTNDIYDNTIKGNVVFMIQLY